MKATRFSRYGTPDVLELKEVAKPTPKDDEVLIAVHATTVTAADGLARRGEPLWGRLFTGVGAPREKTRTLGFELAGRIEAVGSGVTGFGVGDRVFGFTGTGFGAYAEYKCMSERASLARIPAGTTYQEAAALADGATTALYFLRDRAKVRKGERVLVYGASGSIGTYAVQLARYFGAEVTGVCSGKNRALVESLGAHHVIDYTREDFAQNGRRYDVIFDTVGKTSFLRCRASLRDGGRHLTTLLGLSTALPALLTSFAKDRRALIGMSMEKVKALAFIRELVESKQLRPVIDRVFPLEEMARAHEYVDTGRKTGNVVVVVRDEASS